ncbi:MAG: DcaP family trimeric outer membrane transporter [Bacteroidota bacterium]
MKIQRTLLSLALGFTFLFSQAQEQDLKLLKVRMNALERKVSVQDSLYKKLLHNDLPNSRNEVENNSYSGFVVSSIKGVILNIGGFIEADLIHDLNPLGDKSSFTTSSIVMNPDPGSQNITSFSVRPSRISFRGSNMDKSFSALLEFDFEGSNGTTTPRLRHAYITYKNWGAGKYWSNFMDNDNNPDILDFEGPNATISIRQIQVRYSIKIGKFDKMAFSIEAPGAEITAPAAWSSKNVFPDLTVSFEHQFWQGTSHLRVAALVHPVTYLNGSAAQKNVIGGALNFTGSIQVTKLDNINVQATAGTGYGKYNNDLGGLGYDAFQRKSDTTRLSTANQLNLFAYYNHWWTPRLSTALGGGYVDLFDSKENTGPDAIKSTSYASTNLIFYPNNNFKIGIEVLYGKRKDADLKTKETFRFQFTFFAKI